MKRIYLLGWLKKILICIANLQLLNSIGDFCVYGKIFNSSGRKFGPDGVEDYGFFSRINDVIGVLLEFR